MQHLSIFCIFVVQLHQGLSGLYPFQFSIQLNTDHTKPKIVSKSICKTQPQIDTVLHQSKCFQWFKRDPGISASFLDRSLRRIRCSYPNFTSLPKLHIAYVCSFCLLFDSDNMKGMGASMDEMLNFSIEVTWWS